ncbi:Ribosome biogenesis protein brx1 [Ophidiomyces ophidiicola]|nr:Ribosome biogenesis protein brx1 [Ophidiomyces ophidiicola]KAI1926794.1 Ribosome biogenesis protein brx1 [Ophidiomyces ophidiicola]KAI2142809.1 Ribosome biogenesis protein brx1 [Ophidiomyces ophidiicola]KAI2260151.1 Ribosome biogenesis protein brx1 [Ophidiomyces ophidiicola]KAI2404908.1 Ribosome biogenesis protein brx1 [Ophidiomyces ophidiicola]
MAAVYKSISKKRKTQPTEERVEDDIEMQERLSDESSDSESESELNDEADQNDAKTANGTSNTLGYMPKTRVLMLTSRGVTHRHRHLLADLSALLPHTHKESKLDTKKKTAGYNFLLNSLADLHSCNVIFFLEARKRGQDLYLWLSRPPNGPTIKFSVTNLHTMGELGTGFAGNCLKGGRGVVVFDSSFDDQEIMKTGNEWRGLAREMLRSVFSVPKRGVKGMKPFVDRVIGIYWVDGKIWIRIFEIRESDGKLDKNGEEEETADKGKSRRGKDGLPHLSLVEIGPRFVLTPIVILEGSFGGPVIYENREYVSPNQVRREIRLKKASKYTARRAGQMDRTAKNVALGLGAEGEANMKKDELDPRVLFA